MRYGANKSKLDSSVSLFRAIHGQNTRVCNWTVYASVSKCLYARFIHGRVHCLCTLLNKFSSSYMVGYTTCILTMYTSNAFLLQLSVDVRPFSLIVYASNTSKLSFYLQSILILAIFQQFTIFHT